MRVNVNATMEIETTMLGPYDRVKTSKSPADVTLGMNVLGVGERVTLSAGFVTVRFLYSDLEQAVEILRAAREAENAH